MGTLWRTFNSPGAAVTRPKADPPTLLTGQHRAADVRRMQAEWDRRLRAEGFDDIEGRRTGMLRGIRLQEEDRAPSAEEIDATTEAFSRAAEFLHAHEFLSEDDRAVWRLHVDGASQRDIARELGVSLRRAHATVTRLRDDCAAWWERTRPERDRPVPGRPRLEEARTEVVAVRLTRAEMRAVRAAAGGDVSAWVRAAIVAARRGKVG